MTSKHFDLVCCLSFFPTSFIRLARAGGTSEHFRIDWGDIPLLRFFSFFRSENLVSLPLGALPLVKVGYGGDGVCSFSTESLANLACQIYVCLPKIFSGSALKKFYREILQRDFAKNFRASTVYPILSKSGRRNSTEQYLISNERF